MAEKRCVELVRASVHRLRRAGRLRRSTGHGRAFWARCALAVVIGTGSACASSSTAVADDPLPPLLVEAIGGEVRVQRGEARGTTTGLFSSSLVAGAVVLDAGSGDILAWNDSGQFALIVAASVEDSEGELTVSARADRAAAGGRFIAGAGTTSNRWLLSAEGDLVGVDSNGRQMATIAVGGTSLAIIEVGEELLVVADYAVGPGIRYTVVGIDRGEVVMTLDLGDDDAVVGVHGQSIMVVDGGGQELKVVNRQGAEVCSLLAPPGMLYRAINFSPIPSSSPPFRSVSSDGRLLVGLTPVRSINREVRQIAMADVCSGSLITNELRSGRITSASIGPRDQVVEFVAVGDRNDVVIDGTPAGSVGRDVIAVG